MHQQGDGYLAPILQLTHWASWQTFALLTICLESVDFELFVGRSLQ